MCFQDHSGPQLLLPHCCPLPHSPGQPGHRDSLTSGGLLPPACQSGHSWSSLPLWSNPGGSGVTETGLRFLDSSGEVQTEGGQAPPPGPQLCLLSPSKAKIDKSGTPGSGCPNPHGSQCHDHQMAPAEKTPVLWEGSWAGIRRPGCGFWWPLYS